MKRLCMTLVCAVFLLLPASQVAYANMAAPLEADVGSAITFERNDTIAVLSEVLDIRIHGAEADITASYRMQNTTDDTVSTPSMFLAPGMEDSSVTVSVSGAEVPFTAERYALSHQTEITADDWRYAVLTPEDAAAEPRGQKVDSVTFALEFAPREAHDVVVSYTYRLGGYPDYDFNVKYGLLEYYLTPAALWKEFQSLTINLYLDEGMPVLTSSSLPFEKVAPRTYQYVSDTLPDEDLRITVDENWFQNIFSTLRSPYLRMNLMMALVVLLPFLLIAGAVLAVLIWALRRRKRR